MILRYPSRLWHFHGHAILADGEAALVDPGVFPEEIDAIATDLERRKARPALVLITHSHHDHIRGWNRFPGARVAGPKAVAEKDAAARARILAAKQAVDRKFGAEETEFRYPELDLVLEEPATLSLGSTEILFRMNPGHSNCSSTLIVPAQRALFSGDYLVSPGMPYCRWRIDRFEEALHRLRGWVQEFAIETVYPAHNPPIAGRGSIEAALDAELAYFGRLREIVAALETSGESEDEIAKLAASALRPGKLWEQDRDNAKRALREIREKRS